MTTAGTWYPPAAGTGGFLADAAPLLSNPPFMYSMTPPDFRALCAELVTELEGWCGTGSYDNTANAHSVIARARAARAQPEPVAGGEAATLASELRHFIREYKKMRGLDPENIYSIHQGDPTKEAHLRISRLTRAADLLEHLAQPEPEGVTDEELLRCYGLAKRDHCYEGPMDDWPKRAERAATVCGLRAVIAVDRARFARPTIEPVPDTKARELLNLLLDDLDALIDSSEGVAGLHLNGDVASWESLCKGGRFETWLMRMDEARAFLDSTLEKSAIEPVPSAEME